MIDVFIGSPPEGRIGRTRDDQLANCVDFFQGFGPRSDADAPTPWFRSGVPLSLLNGIRRTLDPDVRSTYEIIGEALGGVLWSWWVGPDSHPDTLDTLEALGFSADGSLPHMAVELDRLPPARNDLLRISEVPASAVREFVSMWAPASGVPVALVDAIVDVDARRPRDGEDLIRLGGWVGGQLVGSAVLLISRGVAGIYVVSTRPDMRRRGIGHDMTRAAMHLARERGIAVASLQASAAGEPLYTRMGFTTIARYQRFTFPATRGRSLHEG